MVVEDAGGGWELLYFSLSVVVVVATVFVDVAAA